jgi:hypothetical protein
VKVDGRDLTRSRMSLNGVIDIFFAVKPNLI